MLSEERQALLEQGGLDLKSVDATALNTARVRGIVEGIDKILFMEVEDEERVRHTAAGI